MNRWDLVFEAVLQAHGRYKAAMRQRGTPPKRVNVQLMCRQKRPRSALCFAVFFDSLQRAQEIQNILLLRCGEVVEIGNDCISFRDAGLALFEGLEGDAIDDKLVEVLVGEAIVRTTGVGGNGLQ